MKRSQIESLSTRDCVVARELWTWTYRSLERARAQMLLLGRKSALEKVATFLLDLDQSKPDASFVELPMSRSDIADYLGLTIETVSRTLGQLEQTGAISLVATRRVVLRNRLALRTLTQ